MNERELVEAIRDLRRETKELKRRTAKIPFDFESGGVGGLPTGSGRYKVLQIIDDNGNYDWDRIRFDLGA